MDQQREQPAFGEIHLEDVLKAILAQLIAIDNTLCAQSDIQRTDSEYIARMYRETMWFLAQNGELYKNLARDYYLIALAYLGSDRRSPTPDEIYDRMRESQDIWQILHAARTPTVRAFWWSAVAFLIVAGAIGMLVGVILALLWERGG